MRPMPLPRLLARLAAASQPRLTWYGPDDERVELSGPVLDNWVTKTANLLVEEYEAGPGSEVFLDLPVHWRSVIWAMATWRVGASTALDGNALRSDVVVTDRPEAHEGANVVAVALPALARSFDRPLPPGAVDATAAVMTYGDVLTFMPEPDPAAPAVRTGEAEVAHDGLEQWAAAATAGTDVAGARTLVLPGASRERALAAVLGVLAADGSVVLCDPEVAAELLRDDERRSRLTGTERVTARLELG